MDNRLCFHKLTSIIQASVLKNYAKGHLHMLKQLHKTKDQQGFTIIEVLIVLAIAGLIMLVVFLAVPNLQRSQRNNGRASEAARYATAITNFVSNNNGTLPATANDVTGITSEFGTFKYFTGIDSVGVLNAKKTIKAGEVGLVTAAPSVAKPVNADALLIVDKGLCGSPSSNPGSVVAAGTPRQIALVYTKESASGSYNQVCIQAE